MERVSQNCNREVLEKVNPYLAPHFDISDNEENNFKVMEKTKNSATNSQLQQTSNKILIEKEHNLKIDEENIESQAMNKNNCETTKQVPSMSKPVIKNVQCFSQGSATSNHELSMLHKERSEPSNKIDKLLKKPTLKCQKKNSNNDNTNINKGLQISGNIHNNNQIEKQMCTSSRSHNKMNYESSNKVYKTQKLSSNLQKGEMEFSEEGM